jgi:CSLREA domain-containing protein
MHDATDAGIRQRARRALRSGALAAVVALTLASAGTLASADEFKVYDAGDAGDAVPGDGSCETAVGNGVCTLRAAIQEANAYPGADMVTIMTTDPITLTSGDGLLISDDLVVKSGHSEMALINGQPAANPIFAISGGAYPDVELIDLDLRNALSGEVGAVVWVESGGDLTITGCQLRSNTSLLGGAVGIDGESGNVLIENSAFIDNPDPAYSGSIGVLNNRGGAIYISGTPNPNNQRGSLTVRGSTFNFNRAIRGGGAIAIVNTYWDLGVEDSTFLVNGINDGSVADGGAVEIVSSSNPSLRVTARIERCSLFYNEAPDGLGGAIAATDANLRLVNCTLGVNEAAVGGAVWVEGGRVALSQTTLKDNDAGIAGGGLYADVGTTVLVSAAVLDANAPVNCSSAVQLEGGHSLSSDDSCGFVGTANLSSTPAGVGPATGGAGGQISYPPAPGSPALDSAGEGPCLDAFGAIVDDDQNRGLRPADGDGDGLVRCDRGAHEVPAQVESPLFADDFETGNLSGWSSVLP